MIEFTPAQNKTIASGITVLSLTVTVAFVATVAWGLVHFLSFTATALVPVLLGFFLSLFFKPYYRLWKKIVRFQPLAVTIMLASILVPFGVLFWQAGSVIVEHVSDFVSEAPQYIARAEAWVINSHPRLVELVGSIDGTSTDPALLVSRFGDHATDVGRNALGCLKGVMLSLLTILFMVIFITTKDRKGSEIVAQLTFLKPTTREFTAAQIDAFADILVSFFQRQTVICLIEGCLYGGGFALVGLPYGFMIGFLLGLLNLIPLFGTVVCLPIALPLAYFGPGGSAMRLTLVAIVWAVGQILDNYLITPKIQGNKTGLGFGGVIFSFVFWPTVLGPFLGMLLAIPLSAFCVVLWRSLKSTYIRPIF